LVWESGFFHASLTRYGQQCDVGGMYAPTDFCMVAIAVGSWLPSAEYQRNLSVFFPAGQFLAIITGFLAQCIFSYYKWSNSFSQNLELISAEPFFYLQE